MGIFINFILAYFMIGAFTCLVASILDIIHNEDDFLLSEFIIAIDGKENKLKKLGLTEDSFRLVALIYLIILLCWPLFIVAFIESSE